MVTGIVRQREARVVLRLFNHQGIGNDFEAVIDTGYTGPLSLPPALIASFDLPWRTFGRGILADGSKVLFDIYDAEVEWDGQLQRVYVMEADSDPMIGMELLHGYELSIQVIEGGNVTINVLA